MNEDLLASKIKGSTDKQTAKNLEKVAIKFTDIFV